MEYCCTWHRTPAAAAVAVAIVVTLTVHFPHSFIHSFTSIAFEMHFGAVCHNYENIQLDRQQIYLWDNDKHLTSALCFENIAIESIKNNTHTHTQTQKQEQEHEYNSTAAAAHQELRYISSMMMENNIQTIGLHSR